MRALPDESKEIVVRAIIAVTRCVGVDHHLYRDAVGWCIDNVGYLTTTFGSDADIMTRMSWDGSLGKSKDEALVELLKRLGRDPVGDFDSVRQQYYRWKRIHQQAFGSDSELSELLHLSLRHLWPPPANDLERDVAAANGVLLDWYV